MTATAEIAWLVPCSDSLPFSHNQQDNMPFGQGPITHQDIVFFLKFHGPEPPGIRFNGDFGANHRWMDVQRRIVNRLSTRDFRRLLKAKDDDDRAVLQELATKILECSKEEQKQLAALKVKKNLHSGTRVRVGDDKGQVTFCMMGGHQYSVVLDKKKNPHCNTCEMVQAEDLVPLCAVCDEKDGIYSCSKCKVVSRSVLSSLHHIQQYG
jgi:hypothetical protein